MILVVEIVQFWCTVIVCSRPAHFLHVIEYYFRVSPFFSFFFHPLISKAAKGQFSLCFCGLLGFCGEVPRVECEVYATLSHVHVRSILM